MKTSLSYLFSEHYRILSVLKLFHAWIITPTNSKPDPQQQLPMFVCPHSL